MPCDYCGSWMHLDCEEAEAQRTGDWTPLEGEHYACPACRCAARVAPGWRRPCRTPARTPTFPVKTWLQEEAPPAAGGPVPCQRGCRPRARLCRAQAGPPHHVLAAVRADARLAEGGAGWRRERCWRPIWRAATTLPVGAVPAISAPGSAEEEQPRAVGPSLGRAGKPHRPHCADGARPRRLRCAAPLGCGGGRRPSRARRPWGGQASQPRGIVHPPGRGLGRRGRGGRFRGSEAPAPGLGGLPRSGWARELRCGP